MGKKKRQFIDKKTAHKFNLVHRSQRDPLQADEESSQHVLMPVVSGTGASSSTTDNNIADDHYKYGIYLDDGYDYMQHLKPRGEGMFIYADEPEPINCNRSTYEKSTEKISFGNLLLPSEALASKEEEEVGMLNKGVLPRGPQPDWDPDVVAALDDALDMDDPENILEDDFIMIANADGDLKDSVEEFSNCIVNDDDQSWESASEVSNENYIDSDHLLSDEEFDYEKEETKSRFTNYSMTSSIIHRTQELKLLDDKFERIMEEYDIEEMGCIDHEEVTGNIDVNNELVTQIVDEFISHQRLHELSEIKSDNFENQFNTDSESEEENDEKLFTQFEKTPKEQWDCESIISTYSNIYNHPKLISEERKIKKIQLDNKTGIPVGILTDTKNVPKKTEDKSEDIEEQVILNNVRNKDETLEEKKQRKKEIKEQRKKRRIEKKCNKIAFKQEFQKQERIVKHTEVQKGIKM